MLLSAQNSVVQSANQLTPYIFAMNLHGKYIFIWCSKRETGREWTGGTSEHGASIGQGSFL